MRIYPHSCKSSYIKTHYSSERSKHFQWEYMCARCFALPFGRRRNQRCSSIQHKRPLFESCVYKQPDKCKWAAADAKADREREAFWIQTSPKPTTAPLAATSAIDSLSCYWCCTQQQQAQQQALAARSSRSLSAAGAMFRTNTRGHLVVIVVATLVVVVVVISSQSCHIL